MKLKMSVLAVLVAAAVVLSPVAFGAAKTYQVTGPVLEVTKEMVVVQKGKDRWEVALDGSTSVMGELKVGEKVTIEYRMTATKVEVKPAKAAAKEGKAPAKKPKQ